MNHALDKKRLFVAWTQISRRSEMLSKRVEAKYINYGRSDKNTIIRIINLLNNFIKTYSLFKKNKPDIIFTFQSHPFISLCAVLYKRNYPCVVIPDLHSAAYLDHYKKPLKRIIRYVFNSADLLLIHNKEAKDYLITILPNLDSKLFVLEDPLPSLSFEIEKNFDISGKLTGVLISRFSEDENIDLFLKRIENANGFHFFITGNYKKAGITEDKTEGANYKLTGFLNDSDYWNLLNRADFIIVITSREYTLLSGGYEALALEKPIITSKTDTLRSYYGNSVIYVDQELNDLTICLNELKLFFTEYKMKSINLKKIKEQNWGKEFNRLNDRLSQFDHLNLAGEK